MLIDVLERYLPRIDRLGDDPRAIFIRHHYIFALLWNTRFHDAIGMLLETSRMADRLADSRSKAYVLAPKIFVEAVVTPLSLPEFEILKREAVKAASDTTDAYIQNMIRYVIGLNELHRGRITEARESAHELIQIGRLLGDPRSTGYGLWVLSLIALVSDSFTEALQYSEQALAVAVTPLDRNNATVGKACALVPLQQIEEGAKLLEDHRRHCVEIGDLYALNGTDAIYGVAKVLRGNIGEGIHWIEEAISKREKESYRDVADWYRLTLSEVYLQIIAGNKKPPLTTLLRNIPILLKVMTTATTRIDALMKSVLDNQHFYSSGVHIGHAKMILGLLYKTKKKPALALQHLTEAHRIISQFGRTPMLARIDAALAELG